MQFNSTWIKVYTFQKEDLILIPFTSTIIKLVSIPSPYISKIVQSQAYLLIPHTRSPTKETPVYRNPYSFVQSHSMVTVRFCLARVREVENEVQLAGDSPDLVLNCNCGQMYNN